MSLFILIAAILCLLVIVVLSRPLLQTNNTVSYQREAQNVHYARERLAELEEQLKNASISATDYEALKLEIESNLAQDIETAEVSVGDSSIQQPNNKWLIIVLAIFIPVSTLAIYMVSGTPEAFDPSIANRPNAQQIESLVSQIEARLDENPDDVRGWQVIAPTYKSLGRFADAQKAYLNIVRLEAADHDTWASLADATALANGGSVGQQAMQYAQESLTLNPNNQIALWLTGLGAMQAGDTATAKRYWQRLLPLLAEFPDQQQELQAIIDEADAVATSTDSGIRIRVTLDESIDTSALGPDAFVFVIARAKNGPPAPLAVQRLKVQDLPAEVMLSDADAMMAQLRLSLFPEVEVSARLSKSGNPIAQTGDWQSDMIATVNSSTEMLNLKIDKQVP